MADFKTSAGYTSASGSDGGLFIVHTPLWCTIVRGFQAFFGFLILILSGLLIHGLALDAIVFALVCGLFTMIVVTYALVSEKAPNCQNAYNIWAILSLDLFMAILWLSSMGANAALRGTFTYKVSADCYDDGSAVNAGHCVVNGKRSTTMVRRAAVATDAGLAEMSAIAGLSALEMLLFIATLVYNGHAFRMHHQEKTARNGNVGHMEMKGQDPAASTSQYLDQHQYPSQIYQQQQPVQAQQQPYDPTYYDQQQQSVPYSVDTQQPAAYASAYPQQTSDQYQQQAYTPQVTPAQQQQPYQPPQQ